MGERTKLIKTTTPGLAKDPKSGAVLATDAAEYRSILAARKAQAEREKSMDEITFLKRRVYILEEEIKKIKEVVGL